MAVGNGRRAFVARIAEHPEGAFAELLGGGPGERAVEGAQFSQGEDVGGGIAPDEGPGGRLLATILQPVLSANLGNEPRQVLAEEPRDLGQKTPHHALGGLVQAAVVQTLEGISAMKA